MIGVRGIPGDGAARGTRGCTGLATAKFRAATGNHL
jgi:hypothetical protein